MIIYHSQALVSLALNMLVSNWLRRVTDRCAAETWHNHSPIQMEKAYSHKRVGEVGKYAAFYKPLKR